MVLTNFDFWGLGNPNQMGEMRLSFESIGPNGSSYNNNNFCNNFPLSDKNELNAPVAKEDPRPVSYFSSNGYYGYAAPPVCPTTIPVEQQHELPARNGTNDDVNIGMVEQHYNFRTTYGQAAAAVQHPVRSDFSMVTPCNGMFNDRRKRTQQQLQSAENVVQNGGNAKRFCVFNSINSDDGMNDNNRIRNQFNNFKRSELFYMTNDPVTDHNPANTATNCTSTQEMDQDDSADTNWPSIIELPSNTLNRSAEINVTSNNIYNNNNYNDISRCTMSAHMI